MENVSVEELVRQGSAAMRVGDAGAARSYFEQALEIDDSHIPAWLGLAGAVESLDEKTRCFERILEIDPEHPEALAGLEWILKSRPEEPVTDASAGPPEKLYCANHPHTETLLRCNRCGKPICTRCGRAHAGRISLQRMRGRPASQLFHRQSLRLTPIAGVLAFVLAIIGGAIVPWLGGLIGLYGMIAMVFAAPAMAGLMAEVIRRGVGKRRSRYLWLVVCVAAAIGSLAGAGLMALLLSGPSLLTLGIYVGAVGQHPVRTHPLIHIRSVNANDTQGGVQ